MLGNVQEGVGPIKAKLDRFNEISRIQRHRAVHQVLAAELAGGVHALALHTYTEPEWRARFGDAPMSPACLGGKAAEGAAP